MLRHLSNQSDSSDIAGYSTQSQSPKTPKVTLTEIPPNYTATDIDFTEDIAFSSPIATTAVTTSTDNHKHRGADIISDTSTFQYHKNKKSSTVSTVSATHHSIQNTSSESLPTTTTTTPDNRAELVFEKDRGNHNHNRNRNRNHHSDNDNQQAGRMGNDQPSSAYIVNNENYSSYEVHYHHKGWLAKGCDWLVFGVVMAILAYVYWEMDTFKQCVPGVNVCKDPYFANTTVVASDAGNARRHTTMDGNSFALNAMLSMNTDNGSGNASNATTYMPINLSLAYPKKEHQTIGTAQVYYLSFFVWVLVIVASLLCYFVLESDKQLRFMDVVWMLECLVRMGCTTVAITEVFVTALKNMTGRPRPWYYSDIGSSDATLSFVSGHTSVAFATHLLLVCHLMSAMSFANQHFSQPLKNDNVHILFGLSIWIRIRRYTNLRFFLISSFLIFPVWVASTRLTDYWHHYSDVLGGALFGALFATIGFMMYYQELYAHSNLETHGTRTQTDSKKYPLLRDPSAQ